MKISIITPSLNQGRFIEDAILSVMNQEFEDYEHIIIDGGSTDNTIEILKKYPHLKWVSESDSGQSNALNKGFKMATGDVVGWLNCDERYYSGLFKEIAKLDFLHFDVVYGDYIELRNGKKNLVESIPYTSRMLNWKQFINTLTLFISSKVINDGNLIDESLEASMDKEFMLRLESKGYNFKYIAYITGEFIWHDENKSTKIRSKQMLESKQIIKRYFFKDISICFKLFFWPCKLFYDLLYKIKLYLK